MKVPENQEQTVRHREIRKRQGAPRGGILSSAITADCAKAHRQCVTTCDMAQSIILSINVYNRLNRGGISPMPDSLVMRGMYDYS